MALPRWVVGLGVATIVLCFVVAYHWGVSSQQKESAVPLSTLRAQLKDVTKRSEKCSAKLQTVYEQRVGNESLVRESASVKKAHSDLLDRESGANEMLSSCLTERDVQDAEFARVRVSGADQLARLPVLTERLNSLSADITRVRGKLGMQRALLLEALRSERARHLRLIQALDNPPVISNLADYEDQLVKKYTKPEKASGKRLRPTDIVAEMTNGTDYQEVSVQKFLDRWSNFSYDPAKHTSIFIPRQDTPTSNETIPRPRYFDRYAPEDESLGVAVDTQSAVVRTFAKEMLGVVAVATCALRHNNANLTFPSKFRREIPSAQIEMLNETIETPLLQFCRFCAVATDSAIFKIACGKDRPKKIYGGESFWAARSLVRPTPAVVAAARLTYAELGLVGRKVLAVAYKNSPQLKKKCKLGRLPQLHYMWARALTDGDNSVTLFEAVERANRTEQCQPSRGTLFDALETLRLKFKFDAILVTVDKEEDRKILEDADFGGAAQVVAYQPQNAFEDMVDLVLASWADHILVNRYSDYSQLLTEAFALRNNIQADRIHFF